MTSPGGSGAASRRLVFPAGVAVLAVVAPACAGAATEPGFKGGALMPAATERPARRDVTFRSQGADLSAWLYLPDTKQPWPLVIMAHGFSATRRMTTDRYAEVFRASGLAVLLYDHRGFGDSGGEPRQQINPWVQAREYRDAISYTSERSEIDARAIGLWGDSFTGGVALAVAAADRRVAALSFRSLRSARSTLRKILMVPVGVCSKRRCLKRLWSLPVPRR